jgi:hypothetical protein
MINLSIIIIIFYFYFFLHLKHEGVVDCEAIVNVTAGSAIPISIGIGGVDGFGDRGIHNSSGGWTSTCTCVSNISLSGQVSQSSSQMSSQVSYGGPVETRLWVVPVVVALPFAFIAGKQGTNGTLPGGSDGGMYITGNSGAGGFGADGTIIVYY